MREDRVLLAERAPAVRRLGWELRIREREHGVGLDLVVGDVQRRQRMLQRFEQPRAKRRQIDQPVDVAHQPEETVDRGASHSREF
jgi:hypothetical protein